MLLMIMFVERCNTKESHECSLTTLSMYRMLFCKKVNNRIHVVCLVNRYDF